MIVLTGATGRIGRAAARHLSETGATVRALVRDLDKAKKVLPGNIELVKGDFGDEQSLRDATAGAKSILLVSPVDPDQTRLQGNLVRAAVENQVPYIVKISGLYTELDSYVDSGRWHAETEQEIQSAGLGFTFLRPLFFMQNLLFQAQSARDTGFIRAGVGDARITMIDAGDIAEIAANCLVNPDIAGNRAITLSSGETVTYEEVASKFADALGTPVAYKRQTLAEVRLALEKSGQPGWHAKLLMQFNRAFLDGYGDAANNEAERLLGRPPTSLAAFLKSALNKSENTDDKNPFPS